MLVVRGEYVISYSPFCCSAQAAMLEGGLKVASVRPIGDGIELWNQPLMLKIRLGYLHHTPLRCGPFPDPTLTRVALCTELT